MSQGLVLGSGWAVEEGSVAMISELVQHCPWLVFPVFAGSWLVPGWFLAGVGALHSFPARLCISKAGLELGAAPPALTAACAPHRSGLDISQLLFDPHPELSP